jgi:hypothetical protein
VDRGQRLDVAHMVEKKNNKKVVNVNEPIQISESVNRVLTPAPEDLNGNTAVRVFKKIQRLGGNFRPNSPLRDHNLDKALTEFERAMSVDNLLYKFKHFFNSLEFSTDISGVKGVTGRNFDIEAAILSGLPCKQIKDWRDFYNRTKHTDKAWTQDATNFHAFKQKLTSELPSLRKAVQKKLLSSL